MISSQSPYYYRGTFIHEANFDEVDVTSALVRSRSAPAGKSYETTAANDEERRNYTVKLAEKVDEFVRQHNESTMDEAPACNQCEHWLSPRDFPCTLQTMPFPFPTMSAANKPTQFQSSALAPVFTGWTTSDVKMEEHADDWPRPPFNFVGSDFEEQPVITTFMVRNIPCSISKQQLKASLESLGLAGTYDFLHLPGARKRSNLGYFFINFTKEVAAEKAAIFEGYRFPNTNSSKVCTVAPAKFQGLNANIRQLGCDVRVKGAAKELPATGDCPITQSTFNPSRQMSDISTAAGYDDTNSELSETGDSADTSPLDAEIEGASRCRAPREPSGIAIVSPAPLDTLKQKVRRSRPPKFIGGRMRRRQRNEASFFATSTSAPDGLSAP